MLGMEIIGKEYDQLTVQESLDEDEGWIIIIRAYIDHVTHGRNVLYF